MAKSSQRKIRPAMTPEGRVRQLCNMAMNVAEAQMRDKTVSSQVLTHFLKEASLRTQLELEKIRQENLLTQAKIDQIHQAEDTKELFDKAIKAMNTYSGHGDDDE